jgi:hypothetical protein
MSQINFEVRHAIPGRLRIRVPRLGFDDSYALRLQGLLQDVDGVTGVRENSAARCIIVNCEGDWFHDPELQAGIVNSIQKAADPGITPQIPVLFDIYRAHGLSSYEFQQLQEIKNTWTAEPGGLNACLSRIVGICNW